MAIALPSKPFCGMATISPWARKASRYKRFVRHQARVVGPACDLLRGDRIDAFDAKADTVRGMLARSATFSTTL
jgi:hypothetical protein